MKVRFALAGICTAALGLAAVATLPSQFAYAGGGKGGDKGGMMSADAKDIIDTATGPGMQEVTTVVTAIKAAGLVDTLKGKGPFTVFAPTNAAFAKLPKGTVEELLKPENKEKLTAILTYHVHAGDAIMAKDVKTMSLSTVGGAPLMVKVADGSVMINDARVIKTDVVCSNGVIHWIDTVVMPPAK
ncbi:fasciclin domain-containing protein [soil metagenome]